MPGSHVKLVRRRLDAASVAAHVDEIAATATQLEVRVKDDANRTSDPSTESLPSLVTRLLAGELAALQLRFFADDEWWSETVMRVNDGFYLVRMREGD